MTYCRHRKEAKRFQTLFRIQQTAFQNECRLLLSTVTSQEEEMLKDASHILWQDLDLEQQLAENLKQSRESCAATLELINSSLVDLIKEIGGFDDLTIPKVLMAPRLQLAVAPYLCRAVGCYERDC